MNNDFLPLNGTDYIELYGLQGSGGTVSTESGLAFGPYLQGNFVNEYENAEAASYYNKISVSHLSYHLNGLLSFCKNHIYTKKWYINLPSELLQHKTKRNYITKKVHQYSLDGNYIRSFNSIKEASEKLNINSGCISRCANGKLKTYKRFIN